VRQHRAATTLDGQAAHRRERGDSGGAGDSRKHPQPFTSLKLDAASLKQLLGNRELLAPLAEKAQHLADDLADTLLHLGETVKAPTAAACHVASALAPRPYP
jgi:hypothetical protein